MRRRIGAALAVWAIFFTGATAFGEGYEWPVEFIVDGDTLRVDASADFPPELANLLVRLRGIDAPGYGRLGKCDAERALGHDAAIFVAEAVGGAERVVMRNLEWGKWGGRVIADVEIDGRSLAGLVLDAGLARAYDGGPRGGWC